ncbi:helix-turn-helix domain-containing protein [Massilia antarctica]|nr:helix-turn-helix transcriptional regulator [Massilia sp. H27-R4]
MNVAHSSDEAEHNPGFAERLAVALKRKGARQNALAHYAECTQQAVSKWLKGHQVPRDKTLMLVAEFLNVTPEYLKFGPSAPLPELPMMLTYVTAAEAELLTRYRESSEKGKRQLWISSQHAEKLAAVDLPKKGISTD